MKTQWEFIQFRMKGDTEHTKGNAKHYYTLLGQLTKPITSQTPGTLTTDDYHLKMIDGKLTRAEPETIKVENYNWQNPEEKRRPHPNPRNGFITWIEQIGFSKTEKDHYIKLISKEKVS